MIHLILHFPDDVSPQDQGIFFENFVARVVEPMRLEVVTRLRFTGMEIDLLATGKDVPKKVLIECKAKRDPLPADVISKLLGHVAIRKADEGWLFSTSEFGKDGRGLLEEIKHDTELSRKFVWFPPDKIVEVLINQREIVAPDKLSPWVDHSDVGDWSLIITPTHRLWVVEILEDGLPTKYCVFDARSGQPFTGENRLPIGILPDRFSALTFLPVGGNAHPQVQTRPRAPVARVISGDTWEDLRPARPIDFVGRDDVIAEIGHFFSQVQAGETNTRTFAIQGPSGWGKSSLVLKLSDLASRGQFGNCSLTAVDSRSATSTAFVAEAIKAAFLDAAARGVVPKLDYTMRSINYPLDAPELQQGLDHLRQKGAIVILVFDQFEELFAKEELLDTFNAIRDLSLDLDASQAPFVLGFAWKTDVSLPQQHPAYHLWHQLADRRRPFRVREFGTRDIQQIIRKGEQALGARLTPALRSRLIEQCQGLPWLLKKLLVHVLKRVTTTESQYLLLERELDVEQLFREDLESLGPEAVACLRYVAERAPIAVADVEANFSRDTANLLINSRLLVRSGMNYVIYWDIFRDYLVENRVPYIPWARTFQRDPVSGVRALQALEMHGPMTAAELGTAIGSKERTTVNILGDLVALQLVDRVPGDRYAPAEHLSNVDLMTVAEHVRGQLRRHVVMRKLDEEWEKGRWYSFDDWDAIFRETHPRASSFSDQTVRHYANNLRRWLVFAGLLETSSSRVAKPVGVGKQMGELINRLSTLATFLGQGTPHKLTALLNKLYPDVSIERSDLDRQGYGNSVTDALSLGLVSSNTRGEIALKGQFRSRDELIAFAKQKVLQQDTARIVVQALDEGVRDAVAIGERLREHLSASWKTSSKMRHGHGIRRYVEWARGQSIQESNHGA